jgi:hypothetical protein
MSPRIESGDNPCAKPVNRRLASFFEQVDLSRERRWYSADELCLAEFPGVPPQQTRRVGQDMATSSLFESAYEVTRSYRTCCAN